MGRAPCCDKANVKKGPWSSEEDARLKTYIEKNGTGGNWISLPQKIGLKRCGKSCRLRWLNYLRPNIKHGGFSEEEDNIICSLYISIGSRWSIIAAQLPGRTDNDIKNYWNTRLKKKLFGRLKQADPNHDVINGGDDAHQNLSNSALERLQLHMQLQNPFCFYNNPALWPKKLHPFQALQSFNNENPNPNPNPNPSPSPNPQKVDFYEQSITADPLEFHQNYPQFSKPNMSLSESSIQVSSDALVKANDLQSDAMIQPASTFQAELENFLNNKTIGYTAEEEESLIWWASEFDSKSSSSNSWDSTAVFPSEGVFEDFELGYNL